MPAYRLYFKESAFPPPPPNLGTVVCRTRYSTVIMGTVCTGTVQYRTVLLYLWYLDLYEYSVVSQALRAPRVRVPRPARHVLLALRQFLSISETDPTVRYGRHASPMIFHSATPRRNRPMGASHALHTPRGPHTMRSALSSSRRVAKIRSLQGARMLQPLCSRSLLTKDRKL